MWGSQTPFETFQSFKKAIGEKNVGAMELVALDMKRRGMYIARQLSFKSAEQHQEIVDLTAKQVAMYDAACEFWSELHGCFTHAMAVLDVAGLNKEISRHNAAVKRNGEGAKKAVHPAGRVMTHYWGCHQRFFRQLCMAIKVPKTVELAQNALAENKCVVIGLQSTGAAATASAGKGATLQALVSAAREAVEGMLDRLGGKASNSIFMGTWDAFRQDVGRKLDELALPPAALDVPPIFLSENHPPEP